MNRIKRLGSLHPDFIAGYGAAEVHLQSMIFVWGLRYGLDHARTQIGFMKGRDSYQNAYGAGTIEAFEDFYDRHTKSVLSQ